MRALLPVLILVAGCSDGPDRVAADRPASELKVEVVVEAGATPRSWTLTCDAPGGDHPDPAAACADLARVEDPFAPVPPDAVCTELYGGPQTAVVRGTWKGAPVDLALSRTDGCRTAQWDRLGALLPEPGPAS